MLTLAGGGGIDNLAQSVTLGDTMVFGNNMVNALRFAFNRTAINRGSPPFFDPLVSASGTSTPTSTARWW